MLDRFAKEKYDKASGLLDTLDGEEIRILLLQVTIETAKVSLFKLHNESDDSKLYDQSQLKRLAESLLFRLVYDQELSADEKEGAALICAQAYETLSPYHIDNKIGFDDYFFLNRIIAAVLYLIAGYDPNCTSIANQLEKVLNNSNSNNIEYFVMKQLVSFVSQNIPQAQMNISYPTFEAISSFNDLAVVKRQACLWKLSQNIDSIAFELQHVHGNWNSHLHEDFNSLYSYATKCEEYSVALISLLFILVNNSIKDRAISVLKKPSDCDENVWIKHMRRYIDEGIYLMWLPHRDAIAKELLEPNINNVIAIPTGTGKSLIAEHKIIASLQRGSIVIYLAPTLSLCRQISNNMEKLKKVQRQLTIIDEDTQFTSDVSSQEKNVLVMTPEKCVSLVSSNPELFEDCSLCVVDEFHNIRDDQRGALLDALLSRISSISKKAVFLLLSALVDDSEKLPVWLKGLNGHQCKITSVKWKPSRILRGFIAHPETEYNEALRLAEKSGKKKFKESISADLFFCVQDVWSKGKRSAYFIQIPKKLEIRFKKEKKDYWSREEWVTDGYGNDISRQLGNWLASCKIPVLIFSQSTRHLLKEIEKHDKIKAFDCELTDRTNAFLVIAKQELGFESELKEGLSKGIGIHSQAILEEEQKAVEEFFKNCEQGIVCATGTLAQGLNLPASAVVVNTTKQYQGENSKPLSKAEVINMLGRAGRPGLSFQSVGIIVPQFPATHSNNGFLLDNQYTDYLERIDGVIPLNSGLTGIFAKIAEDEVANIEIDDEFTLITNVIGGSSKVFREELIKKTLASKFIDREILQDVLDKWEEWLDYIERDEEKLRLFRAATSSANKLSDIDAISQTIDWPQVEQLLLNNTTSTEWINWFVERIGYLEEDFIKKHIHELFNSANALQSFLEGWIEGLSVLNLGEILHKEGIAKKSPEPQKRDAQSANAKAIKIIQEGIRNISHISSGYVALVEELSKEMNAIDMKGIESLKEVPICIRMGVNSSNAIDFRKMGIPRYTSIQLASVVSIDTSKENLRKKWKRMKSISEYRLDEELESAIISIL